MAAMFSGRQASTEEGVWAGLEEACLVSSGCPQEKSDITGPRNSKERLRNTGSAAGKSTGSRQLPFLGFSA